jgi:hypothetical protein
MEKGGKSSRQTSSGRAPWWQGLRLRDRAGDLARDLPGDLARALRQHPLRHLPTLAVCLAAGATLAAHALVRGAVQTVDLSSLGASDAEGPLVTALAWDGPDLLQIGTAGQGIASHFPSTGLVAVDPLRTGATVLSFPPLPPDADFAHRPAVLLAPPVAPGAGDDLAGDAPNVFASEARVAALSFQRSADQPETQLVLPGGLVAIGDAGRRIFRIGENGQLQGLDEQLSDPDTLFAPGATLPLMQGPAQIVAAPDGATVLAGSVIGGIALFRAALGFDEGNAVETTLFEGVSGIPDLAESLGNLSVAGLALAGSGAGTVIAVAGDDGRVVILRPRDGTGEGGTLPELEAFRIGLPPLGFRLSRLSLPGPALRQPAALSADASVAVLWNDDLLAFERYATASGDFLGLTRVVPERTELDSDLSPAGGVAVADTLSLAPIAAMDATDGEGLIDLGAGTADPFAAFGAAVSGKGEAILWGGTDGFVQVAAVPPSVVYGTSIATDGKFPAFARDAVFRPGGGPLVILAQNGEIVEATLATDGASFLSRRLFLSDLPDATEPLRLSLPADRTEEVVLMAPGDSDRPQAVERFDPRTGDSGLFPARLPVGAEYRVAGQAAVAVAVSGGGLGVFDLISGSEIGRFLPAAADRLVAAPSADGRSGFGFGLSDTGEISVILGDDPGQEALPSAGFRSDPFLIRPLPKVAEGGLQLSEDGSVLLLRSVDGRLFAGATTTDPSPTFLRDSDESLEACCLFLQELLPGVPVVAAVLSSDGTTVHAVGADHLLRQIGIGDGTERPVLHLAGPLTAMALSPGGARLAVASYPGGVQIVDLARASWIGATGRLAHLPHAAPVPAVAQPPWPVLPPERPGGDTVLLAALPPSDAAQAAAAGYRAQGLSPDVLQAGTADLVVIWLGADTPLLTAYERLAALRRIEPDATLHRMASLCEAFLPDAGPVQSCLLGGLAEPEVPILEVDPAPAEPPSDPVSQPGELP